MPTFHVTELARKYAPWSFSKVEAAETCPHQFQHKHVSRTEGSPAPSDTKVGLVAHAVLEHRAGGTPAGVARRLAVDKIPLTSDEADALKTLEDNIEAFLRRFDAFCRSHGVTRVLRESEWAIDDAGAAVPYKDRRAFFRGQIDLGAITRDDDLYLLDHKSGKVKKLVEDTPKKHQLQSYAVLAVANVPGLAGVRGGINFLQAQSDDEMLQWSDYIPADRIRGLYAGWLFSRINSAADNLVEPFEARPATKRTREGKPGWPCGWCLYQGQCAAFAARFGGG